MRFRQQKKCVAWFNFALFLSNAGPWTDLGALNVSSFYLNEQKRQHIFLQAYENKQVIA